MRLKIGRVVREPLTAILSDIYEKKNFKGLESLNFSKDQEAKENHLGRSKCFPLFWKTEAKPRWTQPCSEFILS